MTSSLKIFRLLNLNTELRHHLAVLDLPLDVANKESALASMHQLLISSGIKEEDTPRWLKTEYQAWKESQMPDPLFKRIVCDTITKGSHMFGQAIAGQYFSVHKILRESWFFSHAEASAFLSHANIICHFADQRLSCSQISKLLESRDNRFPFSWQIVRELLRKLDLEPKMERADLEHMFEQDSVLDYEVFADSDLSEAARIVGDASEDLGVKANFSDALLSLMPEIRGDYIEENKTKYIQILHYQCFIAEKYDADLTILYEFKPRAGWVTEWLNSNYPESLLSAKENAFLNNAKSVEEITAGWARSVTIGNRKGANSLVVLLKELSDLGFEARASLSRMIRIWIYRLIQIADREFQDPDFKINEAQVKNLLKNIGSGETHTRGVIEQRVVDAFSSTLHVPQTGWSSKGLGDSINASNLSRKKIGDCEYQNSASRKLIAYEAHAGCLTEHYFRSHRTTLERSLRLKSKEWEQFSDLKDWIVVIKFVAHECLLHSADEAVFDGVTVRFEFLNYADFLQDSASTRAQNFQKWFVEPLYQRHISDEIKNKAMALLKSG